MGPVLIEYRSISWGNASEDDNNDVWALEDTNSDPDSVQLLDLGAVGDPVVNFPAPPTYDSLNFAFWNATDGSNALPGFPNADPQRKLNVPKQSANSVVRATAWYAPPTGYTGTGGPGVRARSFDIDLNGFRKETPIKSVTPPGAWAGPNQHGVSTADAGVNITAKLQLLYPAPLSSQPPGEPVKVFKHWQTIAGSVTAVNNVASAAKGKTALALAFFGHTTGNSFQVDLNAMIFDWWAEFWGKRGAEGEGPFGPNGPGDPWGPFIARIIATLPPEQWKGRLEREIAALKTRIAQIDRVQGKAR